MATSMIAGVQEFLTPSFLSRVSSQTGESEAAVSKGFTAIKHQREVGTSYFDAVTTTIQGSQASTTALKNSTEDEQFMDKAVAGKAA